jgi:polyhydroxybutyrate depolymerase
MRRVNRLAIAIVALAVTAGLLAGCAALRDRAGAGSTATGRAGAGDHRVTLDVGGRRRDYVLHVPAGLPEGPRPLVLELHGGGGTAANIERLTSLQAETDARGWLVARPDGVDRQWNDGRPEVRAGIDDVAFLSAVIDDVATRTVLDPARVYATGISNGALMSGRLACELADRIAAVGQVAGTQGVELAATCRPSRPVSVLVISGTADPLVPYAGGPIGPVLGIDGARGTVLGAEAYVAAWVGRDRAGQPATAGLAPDTTVSRYRGASGSEVLFYRVDGAGHTWPGGRQYLPAALVGSTTRTFSASGVIVDFFAAH